MPYAPTRHLLATALATVGLAVLGAAPVARAQDSAGASPPGYHVVKRIEVGPAKAGYMADFIMIDSSHRTLYGLGNTVFDIDRYAVVDSVPGRAAGGYVLAINAKRGLARNGTIFDLATHKVLGHVEAEGDASVYDPTTHRAYLLDDTVSVIDMRKGKVVLRRHIANKLESGVMDGRGAMFINREDSSILTKVNPRTLEVEARYPISDCKSAQGLSMDRQTRRLFLGCDKSLVIVNADNGQVVQRIPMVGHADEDAFDAGTQLIFAANRNDSTMLVIHEDSADKYTVVETVPTGGGARSVAVDPITHRVYVYYWDSSQASDPADRSARVLVAAVLAPK